MSLLQMWPWILAVVVALLNVGATLETVLSPFLRNVQRVGWLFFIWLVPLIGAVVSLIWAWRNYRGLNRSLDDDAMSDVADLAGVTAVRRIRGKSSGSWDDDVDD